MDEAIRIGHLVTPELLKALREVFPLSRPLPSETERHIFLKSGQQEVIEFLEAQQAESLQQALGAA
jgi:hypothetical protein